MKGRGFVRDMRLWLLLLSFVCAAVGIAGLHVERRRLRLDALFVVDITGSMNVRDYQEGGKPRSRLEYVKGALANLIPEMPCGSRVGLAIFSERRPFLLLAPVETCENVAPLTRTVSELDWRMAWEGDSYIAGGLYKSIDLARSLGAELVFLTDGQESPPLPYTGGPTFMGTPGEVRGVIVGVGGYSLSPIPKFDEHGLDAGFLSEQEVPQESRTGLPPPGAELRKGWNPRNAPFGGEAAHGNEHLSSVRETYLQSLAAKTGLGYAHLTPDTNLFDAIAARAARHYVSVPIDIGPWLAALGLLALTGVYLLGLFFRSKPSTVSWRIA
jgi:mxaL protein